MKHKHCIKEGCTSSPMVDGLCVDHFMDEPYPMDDIETYEVPKEELVSSKQNNRQKEKVKVKEKQTKKLPQTEDISKVCGIKSCSNEIFKLDFCENHYNSLFKEMSNHNSLSSSSKWGKNPKTCIVEGCIHLEQKYGLCGHHFEDLNEIENFKEDSEVFIDGRCAVEDCESKQTKVVEVSCFCKQHYDELANKVKKDNIIKKKTEKLCNILDCKEFRDGKLYCSYHKEMVKMGYDYEMKEWCSNSNCKDEAVMRVGKKHYCKKHGTCKVKYCRNEVHRNGLCKEHTKVSTKTKNCKTMNCKETVFKSGMCENHYSMAKRLERGV
ncbi:hypothetical protein P9X10_02810 [Bacillus cereus]|nr:hypothetical protein [Bacillus cereus]